MKGLYNDHDDKTCILHNPPCLFILRLASYCFTSAYFLHCSNWRIGQWTMLYTCRSCDYTLLFIELFLSFLWIVRRLSGYSRKYIMTHQCSDIILRIQITLHLYKLVWFWNYVADCLNGHWIPISCSKSVTLRLRRQIKI